MCVADLLVCLSAFLLVELSGPSSALSVVTQTQDYTLITRFIFHFFRLIQVSTTNTMSLAWYHLHGRDYSFADDALCNSEGENRDKDEENSRDETIESLRQRVLALEIELDRYKHRSNLPRESTHAAQRSSNQISSSASAPPPFNFIGACWPSQELPSSSTTNSHDTRGGRDLDSRDHLFGLVRRARKGTGRVFPGRFPVSSGLTQPFEIFRGKVIKSSFAR